MKLNAFEFVLFVADAHDDTVLGFGGDGEFTRKRFALDDERVVPRCDEWLWQFLEDTFSIVMNFASLAVKKLGRANDLAAEGFANRLMTQADA